MGVKGDKLKQESVLAAELLVEKLASIGGISTKKMFGGHGVFHEGKMFGMVDSKGRCYLKVNETTKADFEAKGGIQHSKMPYFSISEELFDDHEGLISMAKKAIKISKS